MRIARDSRTILTLVAIFFAMGAACLVVVGVVQFF